MDKKISRRMFGGLVLVAASSLVFQGCDFIENLVGISDVEEAQDKFTKTRKGSTKKTQRKNQPEEKGDEGKVPWGLKKFLLEKEFGYGLEFCRGKKTNPKALGKSSLIKMRTDMGVGSISDWIIAGYSFKSYGECSINQNIICMKQEEEIPKALRYLRNFKSTSDLSELCFVKGNIVTQINAGSLDDDNQSVIYLKSLLSYVERIRPTVYKGRGDLTNVKFLDKLDEIKYQLKKAGYS